MFAKLSLVTSDCDASLPLLPPTDTTFDDSPGGTPLDVTPAAAINGVMGMPWGMATGAGMAVLPVQLLVVALFSLFVPFPVAIVLAAKTGTESRAKYNFVTTCKQKSNKVYFLTFAGLVIK